MPSRRRKRFDIEQFTSLVDAIYASATDDRAWTRALTMIADATDTHTAAIMMSDPSGLRSDALWTSAGAGEESREVYNERYAELNIYAAAANPRMSAGELFVSEDYVPAREAKRTEFYQEFLKPLGVLHNMGCSLIMEESLVAFLTCARREGKPLFSSEELRVTMALMPHLQRALTIGRHLHTVSLERAAAHEALDRLPVGIMLLDERGLPAFCNHAAETLLARGDGLALTRRGLIATRPAESRRLERLLASVCRANAAPDVRGGTVAITRSRGLHPLGAIVAPVSLRAFPLATRRPVAIVVLTDPDGSPGDVVATLKQIFSLTPAEARVAVLLLEGKRPQDIADLLGVSITTARTHVQRILSKTAARGQGDLVRVLTQASGAADWERPPMPRPHF